MISQIISKVVLILTKWNKQYIVSFVRSYCAMRKFRSENIFIDFGLPAGHSELV